MEKRTYPDYDTYWRKHKDLQTALKKYLDRNGLVLPDNVRFSTGIDFVAVMVDEFSVLDICLPPVSDYLVEETEYTHRFLRTVEKASA